MRKLFPILAVCGLFVGASLTVLAAEDKTVTGEAKCAKCALKEAKDCQNVVVVKDGDKSVTYYMDMTNKVAKDNHAKAGFCQGTKNVKVTGAVTEKDGKKFIAPTAITVVE
jgi:precorrin-3B methylase